MQEICHRCGGELPEGSGETPFCPHCGAPQLFLALEQQSAQTNGEAAAVSTTGMPAPPLPQRVEWKTAIRCAAAVAAVGAVLAVVALWVDAVSPVSLLWIMCASLITMGFYQKRKPAAWMDVRIGARIGVVVGLCLALELGVAMAGAGLMARFALHSMGSFDAQMTEQLVQAQKAIQQKFVEQSQPVPAGLMVFVGSPEFRAGSMLAGFGFVSAGLLALSTVGGAFAGLLRMRRGGTAI